MRRYYLLLLLSVSNYAVLCQETIRCINTFSKTEAPCAVWIDIDSNPANIWQIGKSQKPELKTSFPDSICIITDTLNPYPSDDTSRFIMKTKLPDLKSSNNANINLSGHYSVDCDSTRDYGVIEISLNEGATWIDLLTPSNLDIQIYSPKIVLTGKTEQMRYLEISIDFDKNEIQNLLGDSVFFRFSFVSDGINNNRSGLLYDNLSIGSFVLNYPGHDQPKSQSILVYPNPLAPGRVLTIDNQSDKPARFTLFSSHGKIILDRNLTSATSTSLNLTTESGIYFYKIEYPKTTYYSALILK